MRAKTFHNKKDSRSRLAGLVNDSTDFTNSSGSFRGSGELRGTGRLPLEWLEQFQEALHANDPQLAMTYAVYSYQTPIGWRTGNGHWVIPNAHYSATTTGHQTLLRTAVGTYRDHTTKNAPLNPAHLAAASESTTRVPQR